jgi:hypothetical protein
MIYMILKDTFSIETLLRGSEKWRSGDPKNGIPWALIHKKRDWPSTCPFAYECRFEPDVKAHFPFATSCWAVIGTGREPKHVGKGSSHT